MLLFIDTTDEVAKLALIGKKVDLLEFKEQRLSEKLFGNLEKLLKRNKVKFSQLSKLVVVVGPGPFSRTRTGVVVGNALAFALGISIAGIKKGEVTEDLRNLHNLKFEKQILPFYEREANITRPKTDRKNNLITRNPELDSGSQAEMLN